jgi:Glyoxalase-like domain
MIDIHWVWSFIDTPQERAAGAWEFWSAVTGCHLSPRRGERGQFATLLPERGAPWVKVQAVLEGGGVHLDLDVDDPAAAARVAEGLGARERTRYDNDDIVVMESPGGFAFCLTRWRPMPSGQEWGGQAVLLDQICLDIPPSRYAVELDFWSGLTGWAVVDNARPEFHRLRRPAGMPLQLLLQRLDAGDRAVAGHPDLASADRPAEVARQIGLGAQEVGPGSGWTVMRDPAGQVYCITDRLPETGLSKG